VGYFPKEGDSLEAFKMAAKQYQVEIAFGLVQDAKLAKTFKLKSEGEVIIIKPGERPIHSTTIYTSRAGLVTWIQENKKPLWGILTFQNIYSVWQGIKTTFVVFLKNLDEHYSKTVMSMFKTLAKQYGPSHDLAFVIVNAGIYKEFSEGVGLTDDDLPTFAIFHPAKRKEHFFPKDKQQLNINNAKRWLESFLAGKLESGPETEFYSESDSVVKVNANNFEDIVLDKEKDVIIEFFAPWCGHCLALAPHYKSVAMHFQLFPSITVAAYDVQANIVPEKYNITGLPTLLMFPANNKENPIVFNGFSRDATGVAQFILQHQSTLDAESIEKFQQFFATLQEVQHQPAANIAYEIDQETTEDETIEEEE